MREVIARREYRSPFRHQGGASCARAAHLLERVLTPKLTIRRPLVPHAVRRRRRLLGAIPTEHKFRRRQLEFSK